LKRFFAAILCIIICASCLTCCTETTDNPNTDENSDGEDVVSLDVVPRSTEYTVERASEKKEITASDGTLLISISVDYPIFSNPGNLQYVDDINDMYKQNALNYIDAVTEEFETESNVIYAANNDAFESYSFVVTFDVTYNKNCYISIKRTYSEKYGLFEGEEVYADVFDMAVGLPMYADEILTVESEDIYEIIFLGFSSVAEQYPERFVEDYVDVLNSSISSTEFYLTDTAMVFVLEPGIATLSEYGVLTFEMPYEGNESYFNSLIG